MLDLWTSCIENPIELQLDVLNEMAGNLDMADVSGMILRANVIMLHYSSGVEVGDKGCAGPMRFICGVVHRIVQYVVRKVFVGVEVLIDGIYLSEESSPLLISVTNGAKPFPERLLLG